MAIFLQVWKFLFASGTPHGSHISKPVGSSSCPKLAFFSDDVKQVSIAALLSKKADRFAQSVSLHGVIYKTLWRILPKVHRGFSLCNKSLFFWEIILERGEGDSSFSSYRVSLFLNGHERGNDCQGHNSVDLYSQHIVQLLAFSNNTTTVEARDLGGNKNKDGFDILYHSWYSHSVKIQ